MKRLIALACIAALVPCIAQAEIIGTWSLESAGGGLDRHLLTVTPNAGETMKGFDIYVQDADFSGDFVAGGAPIFEVGKNDDTSFLLQDSHFVPGTGPGTGVVNDLSVIGPFENDSVLQAAFAVNSGGVYEGGWSGALELLEILVPEGSVSDPYTDLTISNTINNVGPATCLLSDGSQVPVIIPEPGTLALLLFALAGLAVYARRRWK